MMINQIKKKTKLGIYIHIPFCIKKCEYCDFLSFPANDQLIEDYVSKLIEEVSLFREEAKKYVVDTVFIGGGTPSILTGEQINRLMQVVGDTCLMMPDPEITIEINPGTLDLDKMAAYKEAGINRISFGLQSADNHELKLLGRIHSWEQFLESYQLAKRAGIDNINIDLMSALPGQTRESYINTLKRTLELQPEHISSYGLIIEEGTPFYSKYGQDEERRQRGEEPEFLPNEETERGMYELTKEMLKKNGYYRYEISNYARDGYECKHNIGYWKRKDYIGFGLGAASLLANRRFCRTRDMKEYLQKTDTRVDLERLSLTEQMEEFIILGLRMMEGISKEVFQEQFNRSLSKQYGTGISKLIEEGLLYQDKERIMLTDSGIGVSNYVFIKLLQEPNP